MQLMFENATNLLLNTVIMVIEILMINGLLIINEILIINEGSGIRSIVNLNKFVFNFGNLYQAKFFI
jgi:hypothetical protein